MARSQLESIDAGETHLIHAGQPAPDFSLPDADMDMFDLRDLLGRRPFVLYFYIKDGTPGCIAEATEFSDLETEFARLNCPVIGVSRDDCITHAEFRDRHGLAVRLLSDSECEVSTQYGAWQLREIDGISRMGMVRSTFVVDRRGGDDNRVAGGKLVLVFASVIGSQTVAQRIQRNVCWSGTLECPANRLGNSRRTVICRQSITRGICHQHHGG